MQKVLQRLLELQGVDQRLSEVRARLARFPQRLAEIDARIRAAKAEVDASKLAQLSAVKDRKKYEMDVEQWKERVRKYKDQGSLVKTNEAYRALQHEIQLAETEIAKAEDRLLEQMVAGEEYDRRIKASEKSVKEIEATTAAERSKIEADKAAAEQALAELNAERERVIQEISENLLDHYTRIARKHNGIALAEIRDEKCSACGMMIRPHVIQEIRRSGSEELFHCETCTRILYYFEPTASREAAAASTSASSSGETL
ncbi:MAG TPA: C4-type zinc ribbon domain-containing protein [Candidatus Acidoferrum sp.]|nr:C4-type zinc ribbon domain-containing protein [Candidatus Acidoferrum sp.]